MKKLLAFAVLTASIMSIASFALAQNASPSATPAPSLRQLRQEIKDTRAQGLDEIQTQRQEFLQTKEQNRAEFLEQIQAKRVQLQDRIAAKREQLKVQLQKVKDERKRQLVEKIDGQLDGLNARMMEHFSGVLEKLETVLERIAGRADTAQEKGMDVSAVRTAITDAVSAIAVARTAVTAQTGKIYVITVTSENQLRTNVGKARQLLHDDLVKVRDAVFAARNAVHAAATALAAAYGIRESEAPSVTPTASVSATPTPSVQ